MTIVYKCHSCNFYQTDNTIYCTRCGVNNRLREASDTEILADIKMELTKLLRWCEDKK